VAGIGLLATDLVAFLMAGLMVGLLVAGPRRVLRSPYLWIGGDDPGTGFDDYLATPERIASWVAELAGSVVGLTGVFEPGQTGRWNRPSSLPAGAVRKSASSSSEESFRKPARGYEYHAIRQPAARNISTIRECYNADFRTRPAFRLRHDAQRQLVAAGRRYG
jgi:hypothetical protein